MINRSTLLLVGCALAGITACNREDGGEFDRFVGTWQYTGGTEVAQCAQRTFMDDLKGRFLTLHEGVDTALVLLGDDCVVKMDVMGNTATARAGQSCAVSGEGEMANEVITETPTFTSFVFTLNGVTAQEKSAVNISQTSNVRGAGLNCNLNVDAPLQKVTQN